MLYRVDVIVGTRGETPEYFEKAYEFIRGLDVTQLHVFSYSERPGTQALKIDYVVPAEEKHQRSQRLLALSDERPKPFMRVIFGQEAKVLMEKSKSRYADAWFHGKLHSCGNWSMMILLDNHLVQVRMGEFNEDSTALKGELV